MYITVTIEAEGRRYGVSIDNRQCIASAYNILKERGMIKEKNPPTLYKSALLDKWVNGAGTFAEQDVVSGDLLTA